MRIVPGHFRAYNVWLFLGLALVAYVQTRSLFTVAGLLFLIIGIFLGDQATHLAQADHSALPPTWIEKELQSYRWIYTFLGVIIAAVGLTMIIRG